ncbi:MAG: N-acetylmuramoyl-L-alanine amidase [Clostridia bacterium]|nr:N-acetylmuramoyl-L-alanine amidase [Clostridia bacterium]
MKDFYKKHKTLILITVSVCLATVLAIILAFALADTAKVVFSDDGYLSYISGGSNNTGVLSSALTLEPVDSEPPEPVIPLVITSPTKTDTTVSESHFAITGTSDPAKPLTMNGNEVTRLESGEFSVDVELAPGNNTFTFEYNNESVTYIIRYNFVVIKAYAPYEKQTYEAGSSFVAVAYARVNSSSVTATFNGQTINLSPVPYEDGEEFTNFTGTFTLPTGNETDLDLGGVKFTGTCQGVSRSYTSPSIICLRDKALDGTQIVEIVALQAETFNGNTTDDCSRPTNSYLPQGTVDYKVGGIVYEPESGNSYYNLRCGKRVYITKKNSPDPERVTVSKMYQGELPEYNTVSLALGEVDGKHTVFTFDTAWRAPFSVELAPQNYTNPTKQDYTISGVTYSYVDIKFFYSQTIDGDFTFIDHPLFSSAQIIPAENGCILRLHLKTVGAFYGWNAEYNADGQLVFKFLNPPTVVEKNDLTGIKIVIDAGHGGRDIGAEGLRPETNSEAERNLSLAVKLKAELENYGATVIMTRTTDVSMSADARCEFLRQQSPDLCISIHHDSSTRASASGGSIFCFNAFSDKATKYVFDRTSAGGFYSTIQKGWHYFYLARVTSCPVVLTENGFISNPQDFAGIIDENVNALKAKAIANGVLDYFNSFVK